MVYSERARERLADCKARVGASFQSNLFYVTGLREWKDEMKTWRCRL